MPEVRARWLGDMKFLGIDSDKHALLMEPSVEGGGEGLGFKPSQLLLIGLAGCTGVDVVNILRKARHQLTGLEMIATGEQAKDPPWTYERIHVEYIVRGKGLREEAVARAIELSETKYCSVAATISGKATITTSFRIIEEDN